MLTSKVQSTHSYKAQSPQSNLDQLKDHPHSKMTHGGSWGHSSNSPLGPPASSPSSTGADHKNAPCVPISISELAFWDDWVAPWATQPAIFPPIHHLSSRTYVLPSSSFIQERATPPEYPSYVQNKCLCSKERQSDWPRMIFRTGMHGGGKKREFEVFFLWAWFSN